MAFESSARLVRKDINGTYDVYVRDRSEHRTTLVSVSSRGAIGDDPEPRNDPRSFDAAISADGRYVAFSSDATNLVPHDTNGTPDVFIHDRRTGVTSRVSVTSAEQQVDGMSLQASVSEHGRYVAFGSSANGLESGGSDGVIDVFVRDRRRGTTHVVSVPTKDSPTVGEEGDSYEPSISANGRYVAFISLAPVPGAEEDEARDVFVRDRVTGTTRRVSVSGDGSTTVNDVNNNPVISADGRYVAFESHAVDLVPGDTNGVTDIFVRDLQTGITKRVSVSSADVEADGRSGYPSISAHGAHIAFVSSATDLVPGDRNAQDDCFVRDLSR